MRRSSKTTRSTAIALHRAGDLAAARKQYRTLLARRPKDPDLLGRLAHLALQQNRESEAATLYRRAAAARGDPRVHLRNLNRHLAALIDRSRDGEA